MRLGATWIAGLVLALMGSAGQARGQAPAPSEYQLKAAFLYHFAQFVEWPATSFTNANAPLVIGILGQNPFGGDLEKTINGKSINNRLVTVREIRSAAEATNSCHLLFVCSSEQGRLPEVFTALGGANVLTVGETERFLDEGGIINFVREGAKIRFKVNEAGAKRAGLKISSKLLSLASHTGR